MKALTICQPYAQLIACGEKLVENRGWPTHYRGPLLIHAGKSRKFLGDNDERHFSERGEPLVFGAVIAMARLVDMLHIEAIRRGDYDKKYPFLRTHKHAEGQWCWILADVERLAVPVPHNGLQGLWDCPDDA